MDNTILINLSMFEDAYFLLTFLYIVLVSLLGLAFILSFGDSEDYDDDVE